MKKILLILTAFVIGFLLYKKEGLVIIPNDAIRIRVIANSNNINDLFLKKQLKNELENNLYDMLKNADNISEARTIINYNMNILNGIIKNKVGENYQLNYGLNYFPSKTYRGVVYPSGTYESLVITLGEGIGDNWWCVLFPPLCLIDEEKIDSDVEYQLYVTKLFQN